MTRFMARLTQLWFERRRLAPHFHMPSHMGHALVSVSSVSCALVITLLLNASIGWTPFVLFYAAVGVTAWYGGLGWALCAAALATAALHAFLIDPLPTAMVNTDHAPRLVFFACLAVAVSYLTTLRKNIDLQLANLLERECAARQDAERLARMQEDFLATVSHELRTPLNSILGWVGMLRGQTLAVNESRQALAIIERNAVAQIQLIDDLLDINRIAAGKVRLIPVAVDLFWPIEEAAETLRPAMDGKQIALCLKGRRGKARVLCDPGRMQQVIGNLLANAIKFTPSGGRITVELDTFRDKAIITVTDTGQGITPDFLPLVFDRFIQANLSGNSRVTGLGLGLALVRQLVDLQGGSVAAHSDGEGRGSTFAVEMPLLG